MIRAGPSAVNATMPVEQGLGAHLAGHLAGHIEARPIWSMAFHSSTTGYCQGRRDQNHVDSVFDNGDRPARGPSDGGVATHSVAAAPRFPVNAWKQRWPRLYKKFKLL